MKRLSDWCGDNFSGGRITELSVYKGDTYKLELEGGQTFFINCAIVADYDLHEGGEMDAELLEKILKECGETEYHFYYPYPDYKFMTTLYSDRYLPKV